jgi:hypothetical protein
MRHIRSLSVPTFLFGCLGLVGCGDDNGAPSQKDAAADASPIQTNADSGSTATQSDAGVASTDANAATLDTNAVTLDAGTVTLDASTVALDSGAVTLDASTVALDAGTVAVSIRGIVASHSDYQSTAVSLLDRNGNVVKDGCINSGTGGPGLTKTLSGDVALPSQISATSAITLVDRGNSTLVWIDPTTCAPLRQLAVGTGFKANPHDYVELSASKAYVPRYEQNLAATSAPGDFDDGNDLLIVDPTQPKIVGRIDLTPFAPAGVLPRADHALLADGKVFVSLNASNAKYGSNATGRLVMVDPSADQVIGTVDLPGTKNCGAMTYLPADKKLMVACTGDYGDANQADGSAVVTLSLAATPPVVIAKVAASSVGGLIFSNSTVAALDGNSVLGVTMGDFSNTPPDSLWLLPQDGTSPSKIFDSAEAYSLGAVLVDAERGRVFLADGTTVATPSVRVFDRVAGTFQATATIATNPTQKLPARTLAWF